MKEHCQVCGVPAEGKEWIREGLPPFWTKLYCPQCLNNFYDRLYLGFAVGTVVLAAVGLWRLVVHGVSLAESLSLRIALLGSFQWVMIFGHELGHAFAGRRMGYKNIKILVGSGRPLAQFHWLGFHWFVNLVPFGGVTLADEPDRGSRRKALIFVAGGPAVNLLAVFAGWGLMNLQGVPAWIEVMGRIFALANLMVLAGNLYPYRVWTPFGQMASDGLLLQQIWSHGVFRRDQKPARWRYRLATFCKWLLGTSVFAAGALIVVAIGGMIYASGLDEIGPTGLMLLPTAAFMVIAAGWASWRIVAQPISWNEEDENGEQSDRHETE